MQMRSNPRTYRDSPDRIPTSRERVLRDPYRRCNFCNLRGDF